VRSKSVKQHADDFAGLQPLSEIEEKKLFPTVAV